MTVQKLQFSKNNDAIEQYQHLYSLEQTIKAGKWKKKGFSLSNVPPRHSGVMLCLWVFSFASFSKTLKTSRLHFMALGMVDVRIAVGWKLSLQCTWCQPCSLVWTMPFTKTFKGSLRCAVLTMYCSLLEAVCRVPSFAFVLSTRHKNKREKKDGDECDDEA